MNPSIIIRILDDLIQGTMPDPSIWFDSEPDLSLLNARIQDVYSIVHERKQTCRRMDAIFTSSPQPIIITDEQYQIYAVNPAFLIMSRYLESELVGNNLMEVVPPLYQAAIEPKSDEIRGEDNFVRIDFPAGKKVLDQYTIHVPGDHDGNGEIILIFKDISIRIQAEEEREVFRQKLLHDYGERVKEQHLFYSTASLIQDDSRNIEDVLREVACLIPPGWQYPEITAASIRYGPFLVQTENYQNTQWNQSAPFVTKQGVNGIISVAYLEEKPYEYEGPFLLEERNLINSLAEMLKTYLNRKENEQELEKKMHDLGERVKEQRLFYSTASLIQDDTRKISDVLHEIADLIPPGWQYPEDTAACITYGDDILMTGNYQETPWKQEATFKTSSGNTGSITVVYLVEKPFEYEGPFLLEERNLINSLAEMLKAYLDRNEGKNELQLRIQEIEELEHLNNTIVQQIPMPVLLVDTSQHILVTNDAYISLTGYSREDLIGMNPRDIRVIDHCGEGLRELLRDQKPTFGELTIEFPIGIRTLEQYGIPIFNRMSNLENFLIVYNDITSRKTKEEEVEQLLSAAHEQAEALASSARELEDVMTGMASGDLTRLLSIADTDPLSRIKEDFNTALRSIRVVLADLDKSITLLADVSKGTLVRTGEISSAISGIFEKVQDSTIGAREQMNQTISMSDQVRTLSASVEEISSTVEGLMQQAFIASDKGNEARVIGEAANQTMESVGSISARSMEQITDLNTRMMEIDKIVRIIAEISSQTNLLALNAAIEAARAGEHGKGFAVVAQEVKNLAGQSKGATGQIEELIQSIQKSSEETVNSIRLQYNEVQSGIQSVNQTIDALERITGVVGQITNGMEAINISTRNERTLMEGVMEGIRLLSDESSKNLERMELISTSVKEAAKSTEGIAESSHSIADLAGRLRIQADTFTLQ